MILVPVSCFFVGLGLGVGVAFFISIRNAMLHSFSVSLD